jgi:hypothetical protein
MILFNRPLLAGVLVASSAVLLANAPILAQKQPPLTTTPPVESLQAPAATVSLPDRQVDIILVNQTGTEVVYQVLGELSQSRMAADRADSLRNLKTPMNLSFYRPDRGPIEVVAEATKPGELRVIFKRGSSFDVDRISLTVQETGQVFLN